MSWRRLARVPIIDELRSLVEQGQLRAASVGFTVLKKGAPDKSRWDIEQQRLLEISLVSVPSNSNALSDGALPEHF